MLNFHFSERFEQYEPVLINLFIQHYGKEYSERIREQIDTCYKDFSSSPIDDYLYIARNQKEFSYLSYEEAQQIDSRYYNHIELLNKARKKYMDLFASYVIDKLSIEEDGLYKEDFLLFSDENFDVSYIDSFSLESINKMNDENVPIDVRRSILRDYEIFKNGVEYLGVEQKKLSSDYIDEIIKYRKEICWQYKLYIAKHSEYGKEIFETFKKKFYLGLKPEVVYVFGFCNNPEAGSIVAADGKHYPYLRMPIFMLKNMGVKSLDCDFIHELIHIVETNGDYIGICDALGNNKIINEIKTQKLAIEITQELHQLGIFIFDNPNDYEIGGNCFYEVLFPVTDKFLSKYEKVLLDCSINSTPNKLNECFGDSWELYSNRIKKIFGDTLYYSQMMSEFYTVPMDDVTANLIDDMNFTYSKRMGRYVC